jgi:hypothetical protein
LVPQNESIEFSHFGFHDILVFDIIEEVDAITSVLNEMSGKTRSKKKSKKETETVLHP